jgi:hypothetical protein
MTQDHEDMTTLIPCCINQCLLFITFKVDACEYKFMHSPYIFSSSLLTLLPVGTG